MDIQINESNLFGAIHPTIAESINETLKNKMLNYYSQMTIEEKKKKLKYYKQLFKKIQDGFKNNEKSVNYYFEAYEHIMEFRKFILGEIGNIDYTWTWAVRERKKAGNVIIKTITISSQSFAKLLKDKDGKVIGLQESNGNLRFNGILLKKLKAELNLLKKNKIDITVNQNCTSFSLINEIVGTKQDFTSGPVFKSKIQALQKNQNKARWYNFIIDIIRDNSKKDGTAAVFKLEVREVHNSPKSSSIFSAIGKYFADEMITKRNLMRQNNINTDPNYPNAGNLTEMYIFAKQRLNNGKNTFKKRTPVSGEILFELYNEVKASIDPFYSGGDYLMNQIKSFLGSNPSLTSFSTIEKAIQSFYEALNNDNFQQMKNDLFKLLLQKPTSSKLITKQEQAMSKAVLESFLQFFSNLT